MDRRTFLRGALAAPVVITTPGLLMPVKPRVMPNSSAIQVLEVDRVTGERRWKYARMVKAENYDPRNIFALRTEKPWHIDLGRPMTIILDED